MTRRTVVWAAGAEAELAEIWLAAAKRNEVASASQAIDSTLADNADSSGVMLAADLKALDLPPLRVIFEIQDDDRMVRILKVKRIVSQ